MPEPLKNMYNRHYVSTLADAVETVHKRFNDDVFLADVFDDAWGSLELKARTRHITVCLQQHLPPGYPTAVGVLREAAQAEALAAFGYENMIFPDFVEAHGLGHWDASIAAIEQFTQQSSGEFAVRPFILQDEARMMGQMRAWAHHDNYHVRRLASEGCRPRLPWAMSLPAFKQDPAPILPILHALKNDPTDYVRRSVANNLNDIAKDNPDVTLAVLTEWQASSTDDIQWITRHALRTLVKAGDTQALALLGYGAVDVRVDDLRVEPKAIHIGEEITFSAVITTQGEAPQSLLIDYVLHFVRANGSSNAKVFKLTTRELHPGETLHLSKTHSFKRISTRRYYPGTHALEVQVNGVVRARCEFELRSVG